jgi:phosphosulfolactate phosphohydrolase-like enzyme
MKQDKLISLLTKQDINSFSIDDSIVCPNIKHILEDNEEDYASRNNRNNFFIISVKTKMFLFLVLWFKVI